MDREERGWKSVTGFTEYKTGKGERVGESEVVVMPIPSRDNAHIYDVLMHIYIFVSYIIYDI